MKPSSRQHSVHSVIQTNHHHHYHHNNNDYNYHHHDDYYYHYYNNNYDHNDDDNSESRFILSYVCFWYNQVQVGNYYNRGRKRDQMFNCQY